MSDILDRVAVTTTVWTCSRCGQTAHVAGTGQPEWTAILAANPPRHTKPLRVAVLCKRCDEDLADFLRDTTGEASQERAAPPPEGSDR